MKQPTAIRNRRAPRLEDGLPSPSSKTVTAWEGHPPSLSQHVRFAALCVMWAAIAASPAARASSDDDDDEPQLLAGLVAHYVGADGASCRRRDGAVQFAWDDKSPDERLSSGSFSARWQGQLLVLEPGEHRFFLYAAGRVSLKIAGKQILAGESETPRWFDSSPIELEFGYQPLVLKFTKMNDSARIGLYWAGPRFELEPVAARLLFHAPASDPGDEFERGSELWRALRCSNCHRRGDDPPGLPAPSLAALSGNLYRHWLADWLAGDAAMVPEETSAPRRMPHFALAREEAEAIAGYLIADEAPQAPDDLATGDALRGERLFFSLGCLACHQLGDLGSGGLFGGGDLAHIAEKRPSDFFARWLSEPSSVNPAHRMPVVRLSQAERDDLSAWLATRRRADVQTPPAINRPDIDQGRRLVESLRCANCHALPTKNGRAEPVSANVFAGQDRPRDWQRTCLGQADRQKQRPAYRLTASQRTALAAYLAGLRQTSWPEGDGAYVLRERNCLACHARDATEGLAPRLANLVEARDEFAPLLPLLAPPALTGVGDKLHDAALADAITLRHPPRRPWLAVRMPRFNLSDHELAALADYLTTTDRIPPRPRAEPKLDAKALVAAGARLVTSAGFGCASCHQIGHAQPTNVALAAHGTDLSLVGGRIRHEWFDRWVRNPARIVPRMEMPAIQVPVRGVLNGHLDKQLAAVWQVLNTRGFEPPPAGPIRTARHPGDDSPPLLITDVAEANGRQVVRPVMIGLPNRHNLLFDLGGNRMLGWWLGDLAHQQTRGKAWFWEPAAENLLTSNRVELPEMELVRQGRSLAPAALIGTSLAEVDWFETGNQSVAFGYRLRFGQDDESVVVGMTQRVLEGLGAENDATRRHPRPLPKGEGDVSGLRRQWELSGIPATYDIRLRLGGAERGALSRDHRTFRWNSDGTRRMLVINRPANVQLKLADDGSLFVTLAGADDGAAIKIEVAYSTDASVPRASEPAIEAPAEPALRLPVVPGYEAVRLPLARHEMPTGLAWRDDGTLVFCSLKGGVWLASDSDGDGLEDRLQLVADGLAAPYGIACNTDSIDVATKFGLIRLSQFDAQNRARRAQVVASGWGYTADYHDWTIGLPRDAAGNYYIGLPCQQDNRPAADAGLRGTVIKLRPGEPSADLPRCFTLDVLAGGLRFPMGLALDRNGELFVTDNQGNYNPFNELNHVRRGARYGFINKLEVRPGFQPPHEDPAIAIPHPWTRSVNGIGFLYSPKGAQPANIFGPFEGHLIGCEYDTRRLIRMSLEHVDEVYQGAAYPFSVEPGPGEATFEGPVVCAVSPRGDLYVGNLRDSGWGGGQNTGSIVRLRASGAPPLGIAEVRAVAGGFAIDFTGPVDASSARDDSRYTVHSYRRLATPAYGGPDLEREMETIRSIELSEDCRRVVLHIDLLRRGFVYEFQLKSLSRSTPTFFPAEAHYTLREVTGGVLTNKVGEQRQGERDASASR